MDVYLGMSWRYQTRAIEASHREKTVKGSQREPMKLERRSPKAVPQAKVHKMASQYQASRRRL